MHAIEKQIDNFCRKHPRFGIPNLMFYIAVANVAIYLIDTFSAIGGVSLSDMLYFSRSAILNGQIWRLFTFILLPQGGNLFGLRGTGIFFVVLTAYFYYFIGRLLEQQWGSARFNLFYLTGVVLNIIFGLIVGTTSMYYINLSMFFSFAFLFPDSWVRLFYLIPVKVKWVAYVDAALFVWEVVQLLFSGAPLLALLPVLAIFNFLLFFWSDLTESVGYRAARFQHRHAKQTVNFKKATKTAYEQKGYLHKCAVCGKTDTDYPDMEFRYCSKCNGYYCYCEEHINNHVHIQ